jgi:hypothetical protein
VATRAESCLARLSSFKAAVGEWLSVVLLYAGWIYFCIFVVGCVLCTFLALCFWVVLLICWLVWPFVLALIWYKW